MIILDALILDLLKSLYANAPIRTLNKLALKGSYVKFEAGAPIFESGDAAKGFYVILTGLAVRTSGEIAKPSQLLGYEEFIKKTRLPVSWISKNTTQALYIDRNAFPYFSALNFKAVG